MFRSNTIIQRQNSQIHSPDDNTSYIEEQEKKVRYALSVANFRLKKAIV